MGVLDGERTKTLCVNVEPGVCGFSCRITARKSQAKLVRVEIFSSECRQIGKLAEALTELTLRDIFQPLTRNPVYIAAEQSGCHASCGIPLAVLKVAEAAMGMALPRDVRICFDDIGESSHPDGDRDHGEE